MNSVYSKVTINGSVVELHSESPSQLVEMIKAVVAAPVAKVAVTATPVAEKRPVGRPRKAKRRASVAWTPDSLAQMVTFAREAGVGNKHAAALIAKRMMAAGDKARSLSTLQVMAYRIYRYLNQGATYGLSKKNLRDLRSIGAVPRGMVTNTPEGFLGDVSEINRIPVHAA